MAIRIQKDGTIQSGLVDDDVIQPFRLEKSNIRGRIVRLGPVMADIMGKHAYPQPVSGLLSEVVTLALLLSAMLKYDGIFTLQIKGSGPVRMLVADVTGRGEVRAYAGFDEDAVKKSAKRKKSLRGHHYHLLGKKGYLAFTVDPGQGENRYQGIVDLKGESIVEAVQHYFEQSEQIKTVFKLYVHPQNEMWRTGAVMLQQLPELKDVEDEHPGENWTRATTLMHTCTEEELLSPVLASSDLLYRLFHEDGVRVYSPTHVRFKCRCSRERVKEVLRSIPRSEVEDMFKKDGKIAVNCEFCSENYNFLADSLEEIYTGSEQK